MVIDKHPFVLSGEKLKRVPSFFNARVQEKSIEAAEKKAVEEKTIDKSRYKPKNHKR